MVGVSVVDPFEFCSIFLPHSFTSTHSVNSYETTTECVKPIILPGYDGLNSYLCKP